MKTQIQPISPAPLGLSLHVISGPRGEVREDNWPCIAYNLDLVRAERVIWSGPYFLGVGHVKPLSYDDILIKSMPHRIALQMTPDEENCSHHWARGKNFNYQDERTRNLVASTAAKLAKAQQVTPKLDDVLHSLLSDGSAYFDAQLFEDWAADLGYDPDSRKAEAIWRAFAQGGSHLARVRRYRPDPGAGVQRGGAGRPARVGEQPLTGAFRP